MKQLWLLTSGIVLLASPGSVKAHALGADWSIKGNMVVVDAYFSDNTPARSAVVSVVNALDRGKRLVEVRTDENGTCSLPRPGPGKYVIVVDAGAGHRKEFDLEIPADSVPAKPSREPTRQEFTAYPWYSVIVGVGGIAVIGVVFWTLRRMKKGPDEPEA